MSDEVNKERDFASSEYLSPKGVAKLLGLNVATILQAEQFKGIPWKKWSKRCWRVHRTALDQFLSQED